MRLIFFLILIAPVCTFGQKISANFSYGGNGVNSFIGQRSYFLNDSAFNIKNSWTFGLTIRLKTFNSFQLSSGAEIQQIKQTNFERVMVQNGEIPLKNNGLYTSVGIPIILSNKKENQKWVYTLVVIPSLLLRTKLISCYTCGQGIYELGATLIKNKFLLPMQFQALRMFVRNKFLLETGPFLRYQIISISKDYSLRPLIGGVQINLGWEK